MTHLEPWQMKLRQTQCDSGVGEQGEIFLHRQLRHKDRNIRPAIAWLILSLVQLASSQGTQDTKVVQKMITFSAYHRKKITQLSDPIISHLDLDPDDTKIAYD